MPQTEMVATFGASRGPTDAVQKGIATTAFRPDDRFVPNQFPTVIARRGDDALRLAAVRSDKPRGSASGSADPRDHCSDTTYLFGCELVEPSFGRRPPRSDEGPQRRVRAGTPSEAFTTREC